MYIFDLYLYLYLYLYFYLNLYLYLFRHTHTYIYMYVYQCVWVYPKGTWLKHSDICCQEHLGAASTAQGGTHRLESQGSW